MTSQSHCRLEIYPRREAAEQSLECPDTEYKLRSAGGTKTLVLGIRMCPQQTDFDKELHTSPNLAAEKVDSRERGGVGRRVPSGKDDRKPEGLS